MKNYLGKGTRFWIVHARLSADAVEGLDTLFSGSYIQMDPHKGIAKHNTFKGLDNPPVISEFSKGKYFVLEANEKGSLKTGSPIYYKKLKAGSVTGYHLTPDGKKVILVGPDIRNADLDLIARTLKKGPGVMPRYFLTEKEIRAIYNYIRNVSRREEEMKEED
jgi:paraquat-inducible protein B